MNSASDQPSRNAHKEPEQLAQDRALSAPGGDRSALMEKYSRAIATSAPGSALQNEALFNRGRLYALQSDCSQAIKDLGRALEAGYRSIAAHMLRAQCHVRLGSLEDARKDMDTAITIAPREALLYRERGMILVKAGAHSAAIHDFSKSIELEKPQESSGLYVMRGDAYFAEEMYEESIQDYESALRVSKRNAMEITGGTAGSRTIQLAPIYQKLGKAYSALATESRRHTLRR